MVRAGSRPSPGVPRLLRRLQGDPMDFDPIDLGVELAGEQVDAGHASYAVALIFWHVLPLFRSRLAPIRRERLSSFERTHMTQTRLSGSRQERTYLRALRKMIRADLATRERC